MSISKILFYGLTGGLVSIGILTIPIGVLSLFTWEFTNYIGKSQKEYYRTHIE